jgi:hypothetical protein
MVCKMAEPLEEVGLVTRTLLRRELRLYTSWPVYVLSLAKGEGMFGKAHVLHPQQTADT